MTATTSNDDSSLRRSPDLLAWSRSQLLVVDMQEKLLPVIRGADSVIRNCGYLMDAAAELNVPIYASEQYPKGLGPTVTSIADRLSVDDIFEKLRFSAADGFQKICKGEGDTPGVNSRDQIVITGIEAHICVLQTAFDLLARGYSVFVAQDAVGSRAESDYRAALCRIRDAGAVVITAESAAFEWCEAAGSESFKTVSRLTRDRAGNDQDNAGL